MILDVSAALNTASKILFDNGNQSVRRTGGWEVVNGYYSPVTENQYFDFSIGRTLYTESIKKLASEGAHQTLGIITKGYVDFGNYSKLKCEGTFKHGTSSSVDSSASVVSLTFKSASGKNDKTYTRFTDNEYDLTQLSKDDTYRIFLSITNQYVGTMMDFTKIWLE